MGNEDATFPNYEILQDVHCKLRALAVLFEFQDEPPCIPLDMKEVQYGMSLLLNDMSKEILNFNDVLSAYESSILRKLKDREKLIRDEE